jgi:SOS response regulatory protein OraA/RecX
VVGDEAFELGARALRHADRSRAELVERLTQAGFDEPSRDAALDRLERLGWLDDLRTAATRAGRLAERGYGDAYIRADLARRGLPVDEALASIEAESERARRYARRGAAWLARRGFDRELAESFAADPAAG